MPATEQTWRNPKFMHVVFGISGVAMLVTTIWMLAADHNREWKPVQRKFRDIETWYTQAKINDQDSADYEAKKNELDDALAAVEAEPPAPALVEEFLTEARSKADENGYDLATVEQAEKGLREQEAAAKEATKGEAQEKIAASRKNLVETMQNIVRKAQFDEDKRFSLLKFARADLDVARSSYNLGVGEGLPETQLSGRQAEVDKQADGVNRMKLEYEQ